jgi:hypothetical protein
MKAEEIQIIEQFSLKSRMDLHDVCSRVQESFGLKPFEFDFENESEWGITGLTDFIELDISRRYWPGKFLEWCALKLRGSTYALSLAVSRQHPVTAGLEWSTQNLVLPFAQKIADLFNTRVRHLLTRLATGETLVQNTIYAPHRSAREKQASVQKTGTPPAKRFQEAFEHKDTPAIISLMPRLVEIESRKTRDSIAAYYLYNVFLDDLKKKNYQRAEELLRAYVGLIPRIGQIDLTARGTETGRAMDMRQTFASDAVVLAVATKSDSIFDLARVMIPEKITESVLAYNLACYHAVKNEKARMLEFANLALDLGKDKEQFLADGDFDVYQTDRDFLFALGVRIKLSPAQEDIMRRMADLVWSFGLSARDRFESEYMSHLAMLHDTGWDGALGWRLELPDDRLPARYIHKRTRLIRGLENELARSAMNWRKSEKGSPEERACLEEYTEVMVELFRIGHWSGSPDPESLLPDGMMPNVYKDYWRTILDSPQNAAQSRMPTGDRR